MQGAAEQGAIDVTLPKANRKRPAEFRAGIYRERNKTERVFGRQKPHSAAPLPDTKNRHAIFRR